MPPSEGTTDYKGLIQAVELNIACVTCYNVGKIHFPTKIVWIDKSTFIKLTVKINKSINQSY